MVFCFSKLIPQIFVACEQWMIFIFISAFVLHKIRPDEVDSSFQSKKKCFSNHLLLNGPAIIIKAFWSSIHESKLINKTKMQTFGVQNFPRNKSNETRS